MNAKQILTEAGLAESHWGVRIIEAEEQDKFTSDDRYDAGEWVSCACGQHNLPDEMYLNPEEKVPMPGRLQRLGAEFAVSVRNHWFKEAANGLVAIELAVEELLSGEK